MKWFTLCWYLQDYESDDADEPDANLENQYYNAKGLKDENATGAIAAFEKVVVEENIIGFKQDLDIALFIVCWRLRSSVTDWS